MKGFLVKDYRLLMEQKSLLIIVPIGLLFLFTNETPVMGISYTLYVITFLSNSLLSYDTFDNGMPFLMTLPGGRKNYVTEKYVFSALNSTISALILLLIASALELFRGNGLPAIKELILGTAALFAVAIIFSSVMLPIQLKFGAEKSRVVMMIVFGIVFLGSIGVQYIAELFQIDASGLLEQMNRLSFLGITAGFLILMILAVIISFNISQKIMKNKSF